MNVPICPISTAFYSILKKQLKFRPQSPQTLKSGSGVQSGGNLPHHLFGWGQPDYWGGAEGEWKARKSPTPTLSDPEVLALNHESRILGQWSNPESGSRKSQASYPWAKQNRVYPVPSWRNHIQGWMNVRESYSHALEQGTLLAPRYHGAARMDLRSRPVPRPRSPSDFDK